MFLMHSERIIVAKIDVATDFHLALNAEEMRLVSKALGGRLQAEDVEPAKQLGNRISVARVKSIQHLARENDKLIESLKKAGVEFE